MSLPTFGPKCPNHHEYLEGIGFPMPAKGTGICPISGCRFSFEIDVSKDKEKEVKDKFGNLIKQKSWKVLGDESKNKVQE